MKYASTGQLNRQYGFNKHYKSSQQYRNFSQDYIAKGYSQDYIAKAYSQDRPGYLAKNSSQELTKLYGQDLAKNYSQNYLDMVENYDLLEKPERRGDQSSGHTYLDRKYQDYVERKARNQSLGNLAGSYSKGAMERNWYSQNYLNSNSDQYLNRLVSKVSIIFWPSQWVQGQLCLV